MKEDDIKIYGKIIDNETRCEHYHSSLDVIAIKFKCCDKYYPCFKCHEEDNDHIPQIWKLNEYSKKAILCGICRQEITILQYLNCDNQCSNCSTNFNSKCSHHHHLYFEI